MSLMVQAVFAENVDTTICLHTLVALVISNAITKPDCRWVLHAYPAVTLVCVISAHYRPVNLRKQSFLYNSAGRWI